MKVSADLALKQSLTLTHDMRLAIDMLSMSAMEIEDVIDEELLKNPFLEEGEYYRTARDFTAHHSDGQSAFDVALNTASQEIDFRDELMGQIGESNFNALERDIARHIVSSLDDDGLLSDHEDVFRFIRDDLCVFDEWIDSVRRRIMDFEPLGCGALDSGEAIIHQSKRLCRFSHEEFLALVNEIRRSPDFKLSFARVSRMKSDTALNELRKLKPRPSAGFCDKNSMMQEIYPEVIVTHGVEGFFVTLTKKPSERLVIKANYERGKPSGFSRESQKRALFMMKALHYREVSLAKVSKAIVEHQEAWLLDKGPLKPLNLRDIAELCGLHESSISRITKGKYLFCDRGTFELKYFFTQKLQRDDDTDAAQSGASVKSLIKNIIAKEDKTQPLSDQKITEKLIELGTPISRRTVMKYREGLDIGPAHIRRSLT